MRVTSLPRGLPRLSVVCRHHYPCAPERRLLLLYLHRGGLRGRKRRCTAAAFASAAASPPATIATVGSRSLACRACTPRRICIPPPPTSALRGLGRHGGRHGGGPHSSSSSSSSSSRIPISSSPASAPRGLGRHGGTRGSGRGQCGRGGGGAKLKVCLGRTAACALAFKQPFSFDNVHLASGLAGIFRLGGVVEG